MFIVTRLVKKGKKYLLRLYWKKVSKKNSNLIDDKPLFFKYNKTEDKLDATCSMAWEWSRCTVSYLKRDGGAEEFIQGETKHLLAYLNFLKGNWGFKEILSQGKGTVP